MKKPIYFIVALIFVSLIVGLGSFGIFSVISKQPEKPVVKVKKEIPIDTKPVGQYDYSDFSVLSRPYDLTNEHEVYELMHYMINTKIEADAIIGTLELTKNRVRILINAVDASDWSDKKKLLQILNRWENDDFSLAVGDHNYVWSRLDGNIGKATGVKK